MNHETKTKDMIPLWIIRTLYCLLATVGLLHGGLWASLGIAAALLLFLYSCVRLKAFPVPERRLGMIVGLILLAAGFSSMVSQDPHRSWYAAFKMVTVLLPLLFLFSPALTDKLRPVSAFIPTVTLCMIAGFVLHALVLLYAMSVYDSNASEVTKLNRGLSYGVLLAIPVFAALRLGSQKPKQYRGLFAAFALIICFDLVITHSRATQLGAVLAVGTYLMTLLLPRAVPFCLGLVGILSLLWPLAASFSFINHYDIVFRLPSSWLHRVEIWDYLFHRIQEKPLMGWGIGMASRLDWIEPNGPFYLYAVQPASHPHNAIVQLWVETGLAGLAVYMALFFGALWGAQKMATAWRPYAYAAIVFAYALLMTAYNFWADSLWSALALTLLSFMVLSAPVIKGSLSGKRDDKRMKA